MPSDDLYIEIFPINTSLIDRLQKELSAYRLIVSQGNDVSAIGGKLSYRLKNNFSGHWYWGKRKYRLITDNYKPEQDILKCIEELWTSQPQIYRNLQDIKHDAEWKGEAQEYADFVAWQIIRDYLPKDILKKDKIYLGNVVIERDYEINGLVVHGRPSVSISIMSHLVYKQDLSSFAANLSEPEKLIGLWVSDKNSPSMKGEIKSITGRLADHRKRLLSFNPKKEMQDIIKNSPDNEPVFHILSRHNEYDYTASALKLIVKTSYTPDILNILNINLKDILKNLQIEPEKRVKILSSITKVIKGEHIIEDPYRTTKHPELFLNTVSYESPKICLGKGQVMKYDEKKILYSLYNYGLYKRSSVFDNTHLSIGIVNTLKKDDIKEFLSQLSEGLGKLKFKIKFVNEEKVKEVTRLELEKAVQNMEKHKPDIILGILPEQIIDEEDDDLYEIFKSLTVNHGIASQVVED